jgi:hypothetical protein
MNKSIGTETMEGIGPINAKLAQDKARHDAIKEIERKEIVIVQRVMLRGVDIPFWDLVRLLVIIAFASVPAGIIVGTTWYYIANYIIDPIFKL